MTRLFLGVGDIAGVLDCALSTVVKLRRGPFPVPDVVIGARVGWVPERIERLAAEADPRDSPRSRFRLRRAPWWDADGAGERRYLSYSEIAACAYISHSAMRSHFHAGRLGEPDITIGVEHGLHGWAPTRAVELAREHGWAWNPWNLPDSAGIRWIR